MSSIGEIFKTYAGYDNIPVIGIINWNSNLAPDRNACVAFVFDYIIMAFSFSGIMYKSNRENPTWVKV